MGGLVGSMWIALNALQAQEAGLQTATNNIANLNTPGYSRQRPVLEQADPVLDGNIVLGGGVELEGIESLRSNLLDLQISEETQQQGNSQAFVNAMQQVQTLFPDDTTGIGQQISAFFQSLNSLSTDPSNLTLRQGVLTSAGDMASAFNNAAGQLTGVRQQLDNDVQQQVQEVNQLTQQIASINVKLAEFSSTGQDYGSFLDERSQLIQQLSGIIDLSQINDGTSLTLTTRQGTPLVVDAQAYTLSTALDTDGVQHIYSSQGEDITAKISGGQLGGMLQVRDQAVPSLQSQLDSLAGGMVQALNTAHQLGTDLNGNPGGDLFTPVTGQGAAADMAVAFTDPQLLAASSDGSSGSNGNLANLSAVANQAVSKGMTPAAAYANVVFQAGMAISNGNTELNASNAMLQQLQQQRSSISGVSLDEEASSLLLYQRAYQAAAEAISTVNQMLQEAMTMGGGA
ncbi:MAG TPA: flagellar hook-associated protein FlgK [Candidatus Binatia bacterium]|nr:flagellar hook-associated protein FlgK [Candidatus Binatia bacterium]